jgi:hypothetical protein
MASSIILENIESSKREIIACLREMGWIERPEAQPDGGRSHIITQ